MSIGRAAHITAAAPGGPRYNAALTPEQRKSAENGIWLCANHADLVDDDPSRFTVEELESWKVQAEAAADARIGRPDTMFNHEEQRKPSSDTNSSRERLEEIARLAESVANDCVHGVDPKRIGHSLMGLLEHCIEGDRLREPIRAALPVDQAGPLAGSLSQIRAFLKRGHSYGQFRELVEPLRVVASALRARRH